MSNTLDTLTNDQTGIVRNAVILWEGTKVENNPEYIRAMVELISYTLGVDTDDYQEVEDFINTSRSIDN